MAKRSANLPLISAGYTEGLQLALSIVPQSEAQVIAQRELVSSLESAFEARRQRIIISESTINWRISSRRIDAFIARVTRSKAREVLASWRALS